MNESMDPLLNFCPPTVVESMDDPLLFFRPESDATVVEFADERDHIPGDTAEQEGSTIEPIVSEAPREELKETQVIKDSVAADSALRSEMDSLGALVTQIAAEFSRVQETAGTALERGDAVEHRLGAIESRLGPLGDLEDVRREIDKRFDALNALIQEVRANTDAVSRQQGRLEQLAIETTAQLQQRKQRDVALGREMARSQSVQARTESAWHRAWELVDRLKAGWAADAIRSPGAATRAQRSLTIRNVAAWVQRGRTALMANVRRRSLSMHVAEAMANLRVPKTIGLIKYVVVAALLTVALISAFVLHAVWRTADPIGPPVVTAPVPSSAVPDLPGGTSATTSSQGSFNSATTVQGLTSTRQAPSVDFETPATRRSTKFVGTLSIRSTPDKAEVHIDRERVGETPLVLRRLRAGSHAIWIDHEGYQRWTAGVNVPAEEHTRVTATLQAEPGR
jgi:hypothetical protein